MKDEEWSGLLKIPKEEVIKQLRIELGKSNSYIQELENKLKSIPSKNIKEAHLKDLKRQIESLTNKLNSTRDSLVKANKQNELLQKQLLKTYKNEI